MEEWQKPYVEAVLNQHNITYGTDFTITGRCEFVYPELNGDVRWDWVCRDRGKEIEGAVEVKSLTKQCMERQSRFLWDDIGQRLNSSLSGKLPGTFHLNIGILGEELELRGKAKEELVSFLETKIMKIASNLKEGESYTLLKKSKNRPSISIIKTGNLNSKLYVSVYYTWWGHLLGGDELLAILKKLVRDANKQLGETKNRSISETFLVLIEGWYGDIGVDDIHKTVHKLDADICSNINFCYLVEPTERCVVYSLSMPRELSGDT